MEKVSFYIPCYNAEKYISECIEAILKQTYPVKEIIVIDDGSTDNSFNIASEYPVKVVRKEINEGLAAGRNTAIELCDGDFIASCDSDVSPYPDWLEKVMLNFTDNIIVGVGGRLIERNTEKLADRWRFLHLVQHSGEDKIINPRSLFGADTVYRKKSLIDIGKYNPLYKTNKEDSDLCERFKVLGYKIIYEPEAIAEHIRTDTIKSIINTYYGLKKYYYIYYMNNNMSIYNNFNTLWGKIKFSIDSCYDVIVYDMNKQYLDVIYVSMLVMFRFVLRDIQECKTNKNELAVAVLCIKNILLSNKSVPEKVKQKITDDIIDFLSDSQKEYINNLSVSLDEKEFLISMKQYFKEFDVNFIARLYKLLEDRLTKMPSLIGFYKPFLTNKDKIKEIIQNRSSTSKLFKIWEKIRFEGEKRYINVKHLSYSFLKAPTGKQIDDFWKCVEASIP